MRARTSIHNCQLPSFPLLQSIFLWINCLQAHTTVRHTSSLFQKTQIPPLNPVASILNQFSLPASYTPSAIAPDILDSINAITTSLCILIISFMPQRKCALRALCQFQQRIEFVLIINIQNRRNEEVAAKIIISQLDIQGSSQSAISSTTSSAASISSSKSP